MKTGFDAPAGGSAQVAGCDRIKLKAGDEIIIRLLAEPVHFYLHPYDQATNTNSAVCSREELGSCPICEDGKASQKHRKVQFQFGVPVFLHGLKGAGGDWGAVGEVRVLEQGTKLLRDLGNLVSEWDWKTTDFKVKREGSGQQDTKYYVSPTSKPKSLPKGLEVPDLEAFYLSEMKGTLGGNGKSLEDMDKGDPEYGDPLAEDDPFEAD